MSVVSVKIFQSLVFGAARRGVAPEALLAAAGLRIDQLADADAMLPQAAELRLWHEATRLGGDPDFGLHQAELMQVADFGGVGFAVRSSATLGEAYERSARYLRLLNQGVQVRVAVEGLRATVRHVPADGVDPPRQAVECLMAILTLMSREQAGERFTLAELRLRHPAPVDIAEHRRLFGVTPRFEQSHDELVIDRELLALPLQHAEPALARILDRHLEALARELPTEQGLCERVRRGLAAELRRGEPTLERLAERLHMSPRSLQRQLQQEGSSLQAQLQAVRTDLAIRHLSEGRESIAEVAFLLGFSEVSTFHRAFKRWTGRTPAAYRRAGLAPAQ